MSETRIDYREKSISVQRLEKIYEVVTDLREHTSIDFIADGRNLEDETKTDKKSMVVVNNIDLTFYDIYSYQEFLKRMEK